jgi:hypothetical protein
MFTVLTGDRKKRFLLAIGVTLVLAVGPVLQGVVSKIKSKGARTPISTTQTVASTTSTGSSNLTELISGLVGNNLVQSLTFPVSSKITQAEDGTQKETYVNPSANFTIDHPVGWKRQDKDQVAIVAFIAPSESTDGFAENLNVGIDDRSKQSLSLDEYTNITNADMPNIIPDFKVIDFNKTLLDGQPAYQMVYTGTQPGRELKWYQVWSMKEKKVYIVTYTALAGTYDKYFPAALESIKSFHFQ